MVDGKKYRESRKLNLATPRRGIRRVKSVLRGRGITPARNETRYKVDKKSRTAISHDTGHALNWVDSLIRKGKGILDSLEEEEYAFKREVLEERQQKKIHQRLVESVLSEQITQDEGYGTDTSFKRFNDTIRNSLTNSCDDLQNLQDLQHLQSEENNLDEQENQKNYIDGDDIVILTDEDEEDRNEAEEFEAPEEVHLGQWEDIELVTSDQDSKQELEDQKYREDTEDELENSKESEISDNSYENELEGRNSQSEVDGIEEWNEKKEIEDQQKLQEYQELEIAKKLASGLFSTSQQPSDSDEPEEDHNMSIYYETIHDVETMPQTLPAETRVISANKNDSQCTKEIILVHERNEEQNENLEKRELDQEISEEEVVDQLKQETFDEQQEQGEDEHQEEKEEREKGKKKVEEEGEQQEEEQEGTAGLTQIGQEEHEENEGEGDDEQEVRSEEKLQDVDHKNGDLLKKAEKKDNPDTPQNFSDYQMIAAQAVQQLTNATNMADNSPSNDENSMRGNSSPGNAIKEQKMGEKDFENPVTTTAGKQKERHKVTSMLENLFKPKVFEEEPNVGAVSSVEEDSIYYSVDEIVTEKSPTDVASEEENGSSHYEILFCDSSYSSSSNEDGESTKQSIPEYVSPFTENPFVAARKVKDPKEILRKTLESLGESFDSESEDQIMEDAREFLNSSDEEYFSQRADRTTNNCTSSIIAVEENNNISIKDIDLASDTDTEDGGDIASQKTFCGDGSPPVNTTQVVSKDELKQFDLQETSVSVSGPAEPYLIEEYESEESIDEYHQSFVLEEITSSTEGSTHSLIDSEPLIEFVSSEPQNQVNMVDIILDEFTAPDFIEEVECESDKHYDELMLEEVSCLESDHPIISTNPIIQVPEPLLFRNIEISDITQGSTDEASAINNAISSEFLEEMEDPAIPAAPLSGNFIVGALGSSVSSESSYEREPISTELKATSAGQETFNERAPFSMTTKLFSSPSKALSSVLSGVKSVGNALTDFVKTIDVMDSESENDAENVSLEESTRAKRKLIDSPKSAISEVGNVLNEFVKRIDVIDSESGDYSESSSCDEAIRKKQKLNGLPKDTILSVCDAVTDFVKTVDVIDSESQNCDESTSSDGIIPMKQKVKNLPGDSILGFGDAITDFVKTVDVIESESEEDKEESFSDASVREKLNTDDISKHKISNLKPNPTSDDPNITRTSIAQKPTEASTDNRNNSDKQHILSEVAALQQLADSIKNNSFPEPKDKTCCENYACDNQQKDIETSVRKDIKPEMDLKDIGFPKNNQKGQYAQGERTVAEDDSLGHPFMKGEGEPMTNSSGSDCCIVEDIDEKIRLPDTFPDNSFAKDGCMKDQSIDEGDMKDNRGSNDDHSTVTNPRNTLGITPDAVRHIEVMSDDSENESQYTNKNHAKDNQEERVGIRNVAAEPNRVPVRVASEEVEASARNSPIPKGTADKQESLEEKKAFKKTISKKRRGNEQGGNTGRRKKAATSRTQKARSRGPITRSRTNPSPSSKKTKRNTRSRKGR
ncbi:ESC1 (YMR219W) [Zygosaccharomyces parabailii]|nr:ESC1 (YMR219W) [Zygosaccharomyces parabailii]